VQERVVLEIPGGVNVWTSDGKSVPLVEPGELFVNPTDLAGRLQDDICVLLALREIRRGGDENGGRDCNFRIRNRRRRQGFWSRLARACSRGGGTGVGL